MHRKNKVDNLIKEWLDLDLPETCVSGDSYTSLSIKKADTVEGPAIYFSTKLRGNKTTYLTIAIKDEDYVYKHANTDVSLNISTAILTLTLSLEKY